MEKEIVIQEGLRSATPADISALLHEDDGVSEVSFEDPGEEEIRFWEKDILLTAWVGDRFAGFGRAKKDGWVTHVFVMPEYRLRGIGSRILSGLERILLDKGNRTIFLDAEPTAIPFFRSNGWSTAESAPVDHHGLLLTEMRKVIGS